MLSSVTVKVQDSETGRLPAGAVRSSTLSIIYIPLTVTGMMCDFECHVFLGLPGEKGERGNPGVGSQGPRGPHGPPGKT